MAETFNGYIIQSRSKHLIYMLEDIRVQLMTRLAKLHALMDSKDVVVCPRIQDKIDKEKAMAYTCVVFPSNKTLFQVQAFDNVSVDIENKTCTCRKWDLTGLPCVHVCAVAGFLNINAEKFAHRYYLTDMHRKAYGYTISPLPSDKYWPRVDMPLDPPPTRSMPGRPKKNRKKDPHEEPKKPGKLTSHGKSVTCDNCDGKGHNKKKCKDPPKAQLSQAKRPKGRPKKVAANQESTQQSTQQSTISSV